MKRTGIIAAGALGALVMAGCGSTSSGGGGGSTNTAAASNKCSTSIGFEGPITGPASPVGDEQLHFAELALSMDNTANKTDIKLVQGDTQLNPAQATTVTQQFTSNSAIVGVVGPGRQPGSRSCRTADGQGRASLHVRVGDQFDAHDRKVPNVLPRRVERRSAGAAGR